jgi:Uncharacterized protein conserved in bacteria
MIADEEKVTRLLRTARGQIDGILRMIGEDRYCVDISNQLQATSSILRKANAEVIRAHLRHCVKDSFESGTEADRERKMDELIQLLDKNLG